MDKNTYLKPFKFMGRISRYFDVTIQIYHLSERSDLKDALLKMKMESFESIANEEIFTQHKIFRDGVSKEQKENLLNILKTRHEEKQKENIKAMFPILYNQTLIMLCTVFETFLSDSLNVIMKNKPETIITLSNPEDVTVLEVINGKNYENVLAIIQSKILKRFDYLSIGEKFDRLNKLGININEDYKKSSEYFEKFPKPIEKLVEIYRKRNDLVHKDSLVIQTIDELADIAHFMSNIILVFGGMTLSQKFGILTDIQITAQNSENPIDIDLE